MGSDWDPEVSEADAINSDITDRISDRDEFDLDEFLRTARATYRLLSQDRVWIDARARMYKLEEMSVRYKINVLRFMRKRAARLGMLYQWGSISDLGQPSGWQEVDPAGRPVREVTRGEFLGLGDHGNMDAAHEGYQDELETAIKRDPEAWLDSTPLMRALSDQVAAGQGGDIGDRPEDAPA